MGKLVVSQFITVDGIVEDPGGSEQFTRGGWAFQFERGEDGDRFKLDELMASEALLLGRVTFEAFAAAWPERTDEFGFAEKFNGMPKYVVSSTLTDPAWNNSTVISGNIAEEITHLKRQTTGDVLVNGSVQLVQELAEHDLVDEYRLMVFPIMLGAGKRLFGDTSHTAPLRLVDARPVGPDGVAIITYQPAGKDD
ncbi:MAG TPA: dihydrofolate reductase family protein [Actinophytocola sp.]|uniref:dihydrofolate reductase family protein n=1 Tax=Actinophytocola sp. TaxID=1872138 RepID=UPI002E046B9B|nr:dihydrofolate reductase family protein [Actinophytocola sp.]